MTTLAAVAPPAYLVDIAVSMGLTTLNGSHPLTSGRGGARLQDYQPYLKHRLHIDVHPGRDRVLFRRLEIYAVHKI